MTTPPPSSPQASQTDTTDPVSLDTLRFQDTVDNAKRLIPQLYKEWTDHNVSDPGITLIEAFAARIDELSYRLGRIPTPLRDAYLRLLAPPPRPAVPARALLTFTRAPGTAGAAPLQWPKETCVAANDSDTDPVIFTTLAPVSLPSASFFDYGHTLAWPPDEEETGTEPPPYQPGLAHNCTYTTDPTDTNQPYRMLVLAADPGPNKTLTLHLNLDTPNNSAPLPGTPHWRIATSDTQQPWQDTATLGNPHPDQLTGPGQVLLKVPPNRRRYAVAPADSTTPVICVALELTVQPITTNHFNWRVRTLYPAYSASASVAALQQINVIRPNPPTDQTTPQPPSATKISDGTPGQRLRLPDFPALAGPDAVRVTVQPPGALLQTWTYSPSFATASPEDAYFTVRPEIGTGRPENDTVTSEIVFGPKITTAHGPQQCGRIPEPGAIITVWADTTRGAAGNVAAETLTRLLNDPQPVSSHPFPDTRTAGYFLLDAVLNTRTTDHFLLGDLCVTLPTEPGHVPHHTTAQPIAKQWPLLQGRQVDAALQTPQKTLCFFFGDQCLTLPDSTRREASTRAPQKIKDFLRLDPKIHATFIDGIHAATRVGTTSYLFKGPACLVIPDKDFTKSTPTRPLPIASVFHNLPDYFTENLHAASSDRANPDGLLLIRGCLYARVRQNTYDSQGMTLNLWPGLADHVPRTVTVTNPAPARGGEDPESLDQLMYDTPFGLTVPHRAVTSDDLTTALLAATPGLGRAISRPSQSGYDLQILLVPALPPGSQPNLRALTPSPELYDLAQQALDSLRLLGTRIQLTAPVYRRVDVKAHLTADVLPSDHRRLRDQARDVLARILHPLTGGPNGDGWPLDRPPTTADITQALHDLFGIDHISNVDIGVELPFPPGALPLLGALDLTINGSALRDRDILGGTGDRTAERSMTIGFNSTHSWNRVSHELANGRWTNPPPTRITKDSTPTTQLACNVDDPTLALKGSVTYQLTGTTEQITLEWTNPPAGENTYTISHTSQTSAEIFDKPEESLPGEHLCDRNDAHPGLRAELSSTAVRTHAITVKDGTNDKWEVKEFDCTERPAEDAAIGTFSITSDNFEETLKGSVTFCTEGLDDELKVTWEADKEGKVTYTAPPTTALSALLNGQELDADGTTLEPGSNGGGFQSRAEITLRNNKHRSVNISLAHSLASTLEEGEQPSLVNGNWIISPPQFIPRGTPKTAFATVDASGEDMKGAVKYTCRVKGAVYNLVLLWTIPHGSAIPTYTITVPARSLIRPSPNEWENSN